MVLGWAQNVGNHVVSWNSCSAFKKSLEIMGAILLTNDYTQVSRIVIWRLIDNCFPKDEVNQDNGRFQRRFFYVCLWHVDDWCKYISILLKIILAKLQCVFIIVRDIFNTCLWNSWFNCEDFTMKKINCS